ncbi:MAG: serine/threonine protein kinase [Myxococcales bacterium]|nr:serine/threonine protein kinase [Myxococcales bacterium]
MDRVDSRYQLLTHVATGGMGMVYEARDEVSGARVALKLLHETDPETVLRFSREATILAGLDHPAIVRYVGQGVTAEGAPYLAMEWVDGETLHERMQRAPLRAIDTVELGGRLVDALAHAHARGVVHRDMKPSNILLRDSRLDQVVLVDFGIARAAGGDRSVTATGALVGTPSYMAPEQARGDRDLGAPTDVYGLGCVLYECLTGHKAFEGRHALALIAKVVLWEPPSPRSVIPRLPEALDRLIMRMLAKHRDARPTDEEVAQTFAALDRAELQDVELPGTAPQTPTEPAATARLVSRPGMSLVIATTAAGADGSAGDVDASVRAQRANAIASVPDAKHARVDVLRDGSVVVVIQDRDDDKRGARLALACARALQRTDPTLITAVTTGDLGSRDLVDVTIAGLAKEAIARTFANVRSSGRPPGAIRLDPATERLLDEPILRVDGIGYVPGKIG